MAPYLDLPSGERRFPELGQLEVSEDFQLWLEAQVRFLREGAERQFPALGTSPDGSLQVSGPSPDYPDEGYQAELTLYYQNVGFDVVVKKYFGYVRDHGWCE